ncbi:MAG TPA: AI-2E family transporter [Acidimicrobiales bacterium]|nr:AI-2E family transporter [Acidimicrobiales bacterium]
MTGRADQHRSTPGVPPNLERVAAIAWRVLLVAVAVVVVLVVLHLLIVIVLPIFIAVLIATALIPPVQWLVSKGWKRTLAAVAVVIPAYLAFFGVLVFLGAAVVRQFSELGDAFSEGLGDIQAWLIEGPLGLDESQIEDYSSRALEQLRGSTEQLTEQLTTGAVLALEVVAGFLIALVLGFFFVKDGDRITSWFMRHVRRDDEETVRATASRAWFSLGGYLRGTIVVSTVDAIGIGAGLIIVGVPLVIPLMILTFFGGFFPLVGATLAGGVAVIVALVSGGLTDALIILGVVLLVQQVESNFLEPVVMARAVALHPVVIIVVITTGAIVGGLVGAFVAVPLAAMVSAVGNELRARGVILPDVELRDETVEASAEVSEET